MDKYRIGDKVTIKNKEIYNEECLRKGGFFISEIQLLENANDFFGKKAIIVEIKHISETHYYGDKDIKSFKLKYAEYILDISGGIRWRDYMFKPINKINK